MRRSEDEALYGGAAGGGKSDALVIEALRQVDVPNYRALILRKTFPQLRELIDKTMQYYKPAFPKARYNASNHCWTFPSGAKIYFGSMFRSQDKYNYQGQQFDFIGVDELTHFTWEEYSYLMSRNRPSGPGTQVYIRATANPGGIGHGWVKARFITPAPPGTRMVQLVDVKKPDGTVIYVKAKKGVLLATGGYEGDMQMYRDFNGGDTIYNAGSPYVTGDGVKMEMAIGAQLWHMDNHTMSCGYFHGIKVPDYETCFIRQFYMKHGGWMEVAADSTRYYNEADSYQRQHMKYYSHGQYVDVPIHRSQPVHMIFDDDCCKAQPIVNAWIGWPVTCRNPYHWSDDNSVEIEKGWIIKADTIEELGEMIGAEKLAETVAKYNEDVAAGEDTVFGRTDNLLAFEEGPFYAVYTVPYLMMTAGGPRINGDAQLVREDGTVVGGAYLAGEIIGSANIAGHNTIGGIGHGLCATWGRISAESAVKNAGK